MTPGFILDEFFQIVLRAMPGPGNQFLGKALAELAVHLADKFNTLDQGLKVVLALVASRIEIVEIDPWPLSGISALQRPPARRIAGIGLENDPSESVAEPLELLRV